MQAGLNFDHEVLSERLKFYEEKMEILRTENSTLNLEIERLKDEIEVRNKIIDTLKEKVKSNESTSSMIKLIPANQQNAAPSLSKSRSGSTNNCNHDGLTVQLMNTQYTTKQQIEDDSDIFGDDLSSVREGISPTKYSNADKPQDEFEEAIFEVTRNKEKFYKYNDMHNYLADGPISWQKLQLNEKKFDHIETIFKRWASSLNELAKAGNGQFKAVEVFSNQLLVDKDSFQNNKEIYHLMLSFAQFLKEYNIYFEIFLKIVTDSVLSPLKSFSKKDTPLFKDLKKKLQKAHEEMETAESKYMGMKKTAIAKDPYGYQQCQRAYFTAAKAYENTRIDYLQGVNSLNLSVNLEMVDKFNALFTGEMAFFHAGSKLLQNIEKKLDLILEGSSKKNAYLEELNHELRKAKEGIEKKFLTSSINLNRLNYEGFLYIKKDLKGMKRRYFIINEEGFMYQIKKRDQQAHVITPGELFNLKLCSVKESYDAEYPFCFEIISMQSKKPTQFQTHSESELKEWVATIKNITENLLSSDFNPKGSFDSIGRSDSKERPLREQKAIQITKKNFCADCGAQEPSWVSLNLLVLICIDCSGVHRKLGPNISKIRSLKLDHINESFLDVFLKYDMEKINQIWEAQIAGYKTMKPKPESSKFEKERWVRIKYVDRIFLRSLSSFDELKSLEMVIKSNDFLKTLEVMALSRINVNQIYYLGGKKTTFFHWAALWADECILELMCQNGAKLDILDEDSKRPYDVAVLAKRNDIAEYLIRKKEEAEL